MLLNHQSPLIRTTISFTSLAVGYNSKGDHEKLHGTPVKSIATKLHGLTGELCSSEYSEMKLSRKKMRTCNISRIKDARVGIVLNEMTELHYRVRRRLLVLGHWVAFTTEWGGVSCLRSLCCLHYRMRRRLLVLGHCVAFTTEWGGVSCLRSLCCLHYRVRRRVLS